MLIMLCCSVDYRVYMQTTQTNQYNFTWLAAPKNYFMFRILACSDAKIALVDIPYDLSRSYELLIGADSNSKTELFRDQDSNPVATTGTPSVLDCNTYQDFWMRWSGDGNIEVGKGDKLGAGVFLEWMDEDPRLVHFLSLTSGSASSGATWNFDDDIGLILTMIKDAQI